MATGGRKNMPLLWMQRDPRPATLYLTRWPWTCLFVCSQSILTETQGGCVNGTFIIKAGSADGQYPYQLLLSEAQWIICNAMYTQVYIQRCIFNHILIKVVKVPMTRAEWGQKSS